MSQPQARRELDQLVAGWRDNLCCRFLSARSCEHSWEMDAWCGCTQRLATIFPSNTRDCCFTVSIRIPC